MKKKKLFIGTITSLLCIVLFLLVFGRAVPSKVTITKAQLESNQLTIDADIFYRQTLNNCGPYAIMAIINILTGDIVDPEELAKEMKWRIYKNLTFPYGVVQLAKNHGITAKEYILKNSSAEEKIEWIKNRIDEGSPIIALIKIHHILHYVTIVGYTDKGLLLYDSIQEKDKNNPKKTIIDKECTCGNRFYSYNEFIELWNSGGYKIFFRNWAIVCTVKKK